MRKAEGRTSKITDQQGTREHKGSSLSSFLFSLSSFPAHGPKLLLIAVLATALVACGPRRPAQTQPEAEPAPEAAVDRTTKVRTVTAQAGTLSTTRVTGVTLSPARESQVAATASGKVLEVLVQEGARVTQGQTVLRLDPANAQTALSNARLAVQQARVNLERAQRSTSGSLESLQAAARSARSNLEVAQRRFTEGRQLFQAGAISQIELTGLEAAFNQAQAQADTAEENLNRSGRAQNEDLALLRLQIQQSQNQLAQAQRALADTQVKAPFSGVVAELFLNPGEFVATGARAFRLADTSRVEASFRLTPEDAAGLAGGSKVQVLFGGRTYPATVTRSARVPGTDRLVEVIARVESSLTPGANAQVNYTLNLANGVIVPSGALQTEGRATFVYVSRGGKAVRTNVEVLGDTGNRAAVRGLQNGAAVVFPVPVSLDDGDAIEVVQ